VPQLLNGLARETGVEIMTVGPIEPFAIENETYADDYLTDLLANPDYRSMDEVRRRAQKYIKNDHLRDYFVNKAQELLKT
jgi:hypothetical protein